MGLTVSKTSETQYLPVFQKVFEDIPGGATISTGDLKSDSTEIKAGAIVGADPDTDGLYRLIKTAEVYADGDGEDNTIQVLKTHEFKVEDFISNGSKSSKIQSIDTTNDDYDVISVVAGFAHEDGDYLYQSTSEGTEAADIALKYTPAGITKNNIDVVTYSLSGSVTHANVSSGIVVRGTVVESLLPYVVPTVVKTALTDRIRFA